MKTTRWSVRVNPKYVKDICVTHFQIWLKDKYHEVYVTKKQRGEWETREEAEDAINMPYEEVVEVKGKQQ